MNQAQFVTFHTTHDLDGVPEGTVFEPTWRMRNTGATTWDNIFTVRLINIEQGSKLMAARPTFNLADVTDRTTVAPGEEVNITIPMEALPPRDTLQFTDWQLTDPDGTQFGDIMWLRIIVTDPPQPPDIFKSSDSQFLADLTIPDGTKIVTGSTFSKQWQVRNNGERIWNDGYRLVFTGGDAYMSTQVSIKVPRTRPDEEAVLTVPMMAPAPRSQPYISYWRIQDDREVLFGDQFWVKIEATPQPNNIKLYSQNDIRWRNRVLGYGPRTFGDYGCLVTCFAMILNGFGENVTPRTANDRFLQLPPGQGYVGSDIFFIAPAAAYDHVQFHGNYKPKLDTGALYAQLDGNLLQRIDASLARGDMVIFQVDATPLTPYNPDLDQHWVVCKERQGNDYLIYDPITGEALTLLSRYGRQTRVSDGEPALLEAIKSALFYRSTTTPSGMQPGEDGISDISNTLVYTGPAWPFGRTLSGIHDRANRHPQSWDFEITDGQFDTVKVMSGITTSELFGYDLNTDFVLARLYESWGGRDLSPQDFVDAVAPDMERLVNAGVRYFEMHNEPNLTHEGLDAANVNGSWKDGAEFADFFIEVQRLLKLRFGSHIKIGFPGLSPGADTFYQVGPDSGFRMDSKRFLADAAPAVAAADFVGLHAYFANMDEVHSGATRLVREYRKQFPDKLLFVTEYSNPLTQVPSAEKGRQNKEFLRLISDIPGVGAAYYFLVSGNGWEHQALRREGSAQSTGILEAMV